MSELDDKKPEAPEIKQNDRPKVGSGIQPGHEGDATSRWSEIKGRGPDTITEDELKDEGHGNKRHGNKRHGPDTTREQHIERVHTYKAPDGVWSPTDRSTRFDDQAAQLEAVNKAKALVGKWDADGLVDHYDTTRAGKQIPHKETVVVNDRPGGYGSGVEIKKGADGRYIPGNPVTDTDQDPNAKVTLEYNGETKRWDPVTQFPTNEPVTPEKRK